MITSITATIYISDMDRAVDFYNQTLGLPLVGRWGNEYASIDLGKGAAIGLHPANSLKIPRPGTHARSRSASRWTDRSTTSFAT